MAGPVDRAALARTSPLLAALPKTAWQEARLADLPKGFNLFSRGDQPSAMFFVTSGEVHLVRRSLRGSTVVLQRTRSGFLAEASLDQSTYHCDAIAVAPTTVLAMPRKVVVGALGHEEFRTNWIRQLSRELRHVRAQAERMSLRSAEERIIHFVITEGDNGMLRLTHSKKVWASELGLTHEALYRALARMKRAGHIKDDDGVLSLRG